MAVIRRRYSDRKADAKRHYLRVLGDDGDVELAKQNPPKGMKLENWHRAVDHFCTPEHKRKSALAKAARQKQTNTYRGGSSSLASHCYKKVYTHTYT